MFQQTGIKRGFPPSNFYEASCQCLGLGEQWRIMTNALKNAMTNTYVVIFCQLHVFGPGYHS